MEILKHLGVTWIICLFLFSSESFSQINSVDDAYEVLDSYKLNPTPESTDAYHLLLKQWKPSNDEERLAKVVSLCNLGYYQQRFSQLTAAIQNYEEAKKLFGPPNPSVYDMLNSCYIPLGNLYTKTNALGEAESTIKEYILVAQDQNRREEEIKGLLNLSIVMQSKGDFKQAIFMLERGLGLAPNANKLKLALANNYFNNDQLEISEGLVNEILKNDPSNVFGLQLLAKLQLAKGEPDVALSTLNRVLQLFQKDKNTSPRDLAKLYLSIAQFELINGNKKNAKSSLIKLFATLIPEFSIGQNIPAEDQLFPENTLIDALDLQATVLEREKDLIGAYAAYDRAFQVQALLNSSVLLQESKLVQQTNNKIRSEKCLNLLFRLHKNSERDTFWLREAIWVDDRSKSPVVQEARNWKRLISQHADSDLAKSIVEVQQRLVEKQLQIDEAMQSYSYDQARLSELHTGFNQILLEQRNLHEEFKAQYPNEFKEAKITIADLEKGTKRKGETVISYFVGQNTVFQLKISDGKGSFHRLAEDQPSRDAFLKSCIEFNRLFENPSVINNDPGLFAQKSHELFEKLNIPLAKRLVVIPDGILSFVPMSALLKTSTDATSFEKMPFLINDTEVSYKLSFTSDGETTEKLISKPIVLGVFPVFKGTDRELTYSLEEAEAIEEAVSAHLLMEDKASTAQFLKELDRFNTIHISTHATGGSFTEPAAIEFADRILTINELYGYQFNKDLVVLSACETGIGKVLKGEGALSIARAFQYTGTKNVLFSQWKVNDRSTAKLMGDFYKNYAGSGSKNQALHQAKLDYLKNPDLDNSKKSPYYWAGFVYYGSTDTIAASNYWWLILPGILLLVAILIFLRKKTRSNSFK